MTVVRRDGDAGVQGEALGVHAGVVDEPVREREGRVATPGEWLATFRSEGDPSL
jgi:hypothetical protein